VNSVSVVGGRKLRCYELDWIRRKVVE